MMAWRGLMPGYGMSILRRKWTAYDRHRIFPVVVRPEPDPDVLVPVHVVVKSSPGGTEA